MAFNSSSVWNNLHVEEITILALVRRINLLRFLTAFLLKIISFSSG